LITLVDPFETFSLENDKDRQRPEISFLRGKEGK